MAIEALPELAAQLITAKARFGYRWCVHTSNTHPDY